MQEAKARGPSLAKAGMRLSRQRGSGADGCENGAEHAGPREGGDATVRTARIVCEPAKEQWQQCVEFREERTVGAASHPTIVRRTVRTNSLKDQG